MPQLHSPLRFCAVLLVGLLAWGSATDAAPPKRDLALEEALRRKTTKLYAEQCKRLQKVVEWCIKNDLKTQAAELVETMADTQATYESIPELREEIEGLSGTEISEDQQKSLDGKLAKVNSKNAKDMFDLAKKCMKVGLFTKAYDLVNAVVVADADHKKARKVLGYTFDKKGKTWITNWEAAQRKKHVLFGEEGWVPKKELKKWEEGLRPFAGDWVTVEEEKKKRTQNEYRAWEVASEHFRIKTNLGRAEGWKFCVLLEDFYRTFFRVFVGFFDQEAGAKLLFNVAELESKHFVKYFPSREKYLTHVKAEHGNDQLLKDSAGFYSGGGDRCSHFYWSNDSEDTLATTYHEVTHQLFAETKQGAGGSKGNNWVVEGIASYTETWIKGEDGRWVPGGNPKINRMRMAQQYLAQGGFNLSSFIAIDHDQFHKQNRGLNYALSCAFSYFLMHYDEERYKEDFVQLISAYYGGKLRPDSFLGYIQMENVSGSEKMQKLQEQFLTFMKELDLN